MSKYIKELLIKDVEKKLSGVSEFLVISTQGVNGIENNVMRGQLKAKGIRMTVVKNSSVQKALSNLGFTAAAGLFTGPCAVVYGADNAVDLAKEVVGWAKKVKAIQIKGAFVEGSSMDGTGATALSKMPTKVELQGAIVMLMNSPASRLAGAIGGPASAIAGCIKTIIDKAEKGEKSEAA